MLPYKFEVFLLVMCMAKDSLQKLVELNHDFADDTLVFPNSNFIKFKLTPAGKGYRDGYWYVANNYEGTEHSGTHMDAPFHFAESGWAIDQIPIEHLFAKALVIDIREKVAKDPLYTLKADDIINWVNKYGPIPNNSVVLVLTGWDKKYSNANSYFGMTASSTTKVYPGIDLSAAKMLVGYKNKSNINIFGVGIDAPSMDPGNTKDFASHRELYAANIYGLENLHSLDKLPITGAELTVMPMKIRGGGGAPLRVIARTPENGASLHFSSAGIILLSSLFISWFN